jgi:alpha-glucosidase
VAEWWESAVVYEVYPRSFGDLRGIADRLEHIKWLGADAIWLAPIYASPGADMGYDVSDHTAVAPALGTLDDFDALLAAAHRRGVRVLLDLVVSHTSIEHPWFREHPDFYVWDDGPEPPNNWIASFGGPAWTRDERSGRLYLHSFYPEQPDLDWRNPAVREAMGDVVRFWADRGVDGFRVDAVDRLVKDLELRDDPASREPFPLPVHPDQQTFDLVHSRDAPEIDLALAALREAAGELPMIAEVYLPADRARRYLRHFDAAFAFDLLHAPWNRDAIAAAIERSLAVGRPAWVTSNHDFSRVASRWGERNARAAAVLLFTLGGIAFVYQGEEIGMADGAAPDPPADRFGRDAFRTPIRWEEVEAQRGVPGSMLELVRELIDVRRGMRGDPVVVDSAPGTLAFRREDHEVTIDFGSGSAVVRAAGEVMFRT